MSSLNAMREVIQRASNVLREIEETWTRIEEVYRRLKEGERLAKRGGVDESTLRALREEAMKDACAHFLKYLDLLERGREELQELKVIQAKAMLELDDIRRSRSLGASRSDFYTVVRGRIREITSMIRDLQRYLEIPNLDVLLFLLESYVEKSDELGGESRVEDVLKLARGFGDKWSEERLKIEGEISSLESKIEELRDQLREVEIRFAIGEYDRGTFEEKRLSIERELERALEERNSKERLLEERDSRFLRVMEKLEGMMK